MLLKPYSKFKTHIRLAKNRFLGAAGYISGYHPAGPVFRFLVILVLAALSSQMFLGEEWLIRDSGPGQAGGPEVVEDTAAVAPSIPGIIRTAAALQTGNPSVDAPLEEGAALESTPEDFSGFFFIFDDTVRAHGNPSISSLMPLAERTGFLTYVVEPGDSAASIAERFGISLDTVLWANNLNRGSILKPGQTLTILPVSGVIHRVGSGETLSEISRRYGVNVNSILAANNLSEGNNIAAGMQLIIPGGRPVSSSAVASTPSRITASTPALGYFRPPTIGLNWGRRHNYNAVDIANACGTPVFAAQEGLVLSTSQGSWNRGYGNLIKIVHPNGTETWYAHLGAVLVSEGAYVNQGDIIGSIGNTGKTHGPTGCHLHFEVRGGPNPFVR